MGLLKPYLLEPALLRKETRKYIRAAFHKLGYRDQDALPVKVWIRCPIFNDRPMKEPTMTENTTAGIFCMLAEKATRGQTSIIKVDNLSTALFLVTMGKGICIAPQYVKNMLPSETFIVSIGDRNCRFDEYLYYNENGNGAAKLFYEEFQGTLSSE